MKIIDVLAGKKDRSPPPSEEDEIVMLTRRHVEALKRVERVVRMARVDAELEAKRR